MQDGAAAEPAPTAEPALTTVGATALGTTTIATLLTGMREMLRIARALVAARRCVDLAGLDTLAGSLFAQLLDLPPEHGRPMRPALHALLAEADALLAALREQAGDFGAAAPPRPP